jgi:predicted nucleic acid-binding protein
VSILLDTTVFIDLLRQFEPGVLYFRSLQSQPFAASVTIAELYAGVREGRERIALDRLVRGIECVAVDDLIARHAGLWRRQFGPSHGTGIMDALIAACAVRVSAKLVTHNRKHFPMLTDVVVPY